MMGNKVGVSIWVKERSESFSNVARLLGGGGKDEREMRRRRRE
jgi:hypothetical protein